METWEKEELYQKSLNRQDAYIVFMAAGETDLSLLPEPITQTENRLYELCKVNTEAPMKALEESILAAKHPATSEAPPEETKPVKRAARRAAKK